MFKKMSVVFALSFVLLAACGSTAAKFSTNDFMTLVDKHIDAKNALVDNFDIQEGENLQGMAKRIVASEQYSAFQKIAKELIAYDISAAPDDTKEKFASYQALVKKDSDGIQNFLAKVSDIPDEEAAITLFMEYAEQAGTVEDKMYEEYSKLFEEFVK